MGISLQKGQRISLKKEAPKLERLMCGLGWDVAEKKGGFLGSLLGGGSNFDLDASVICCGKNRKSANPQRDIIYFGNLRHYSDAILHMGDNLTGEGDGDDEEIIINLKQVPQDIDKLIIVVNIYNAFSRQQDFSQVKNAFIRLVDLVNKKEIARYTLSGSQYQNQTGMIMADFIRNGDDWEMGAKGEGVRVEDLGALVKFCV
ncbi:MAG: TerD family protein [Cyanobacterium sp. T60_A2020_053]|nr:TerD family protein [Cyanobacterium sp. T60_A2020_053]